MNDQEMLDRAARVYELLAAGEIEAILEMIADDAQYRNPDDAMETGVRSGRDEIRQALIGLLDTLDFDRLEIGDSRRFGNSMLMRVSWTATGKGSGATVVQHLAHVFSFEADEIVGFEWFLEWDQAIAVLEAR